MTGRKMKLDRPARLTSKLPSSLLRAFERRLTDPGTNKIPMGARQAVLVRYIRAFLRGQDPQTYYNLVEQLSRAQTEDAFRYHLGKLVEFHEKARRATEAFEQPDPDLEKSGNMG